jgi:hypothetical protein
MSEETRVHLSYAQALDLMTDDEMIHTFRAAGPMSIGADWQRSDVLALIRKYGAEPAGEHATALGYRLAIIDDHGLLFIKTKEPIR